MRTMKILAVVLVAVAIVSLGGPADAAPKGAAEPLDKRSGFYDFATFQETLPSGFTGPGMGTIPGIVCEQATDAAPPEFAGNFLLNCDSIGPHNETTVSVNPKVANNVVAGSHSYLLEQVGSTLNVHVISVAYVTKDGGATWSNVHPPLGSYQFAGDPVLAFDSQGRVYYFNIADHEGQGGSFTNVSVIAQRSDDGGLTWTDPVTVAEGQGAISVGGVQMVVFNDKEWGTADAHGGSPYRNNVYLTWTRFLYAQGQYVESPIYFSESTDGGRTWTPGVEISGRNAALCSAQVDTSGGADRCDENQFSQPVVAPDGTIYVSFFNEQRVDDGEFRDQVLLVKSTDGGRSWSDPVAATPLIHDGSNDYPLNSDDRQRLSGCAYRVNSSGALAVAPGDPQRLFYVYTENKNPGIEGPTRTDIMVVASSDGGVTWSDPVTVNTSRKDQVYPWAVVGLDGRLRVSYIDHGRPSVEDQTCVYGYTLSTERKAGTLRFEHRALETGLSIASDSRWFSQNTRFIGDYTNLAVAPDGTIWADWTDMRQTVDLFGRPGKDQDAVAERVAP